MKIYVVCPVRKQTDEQAFDIEKYVSEMEAKGNDVYYPKRDAPQDDETGYNIVMEELEAIKQCDEVHLFWDVNSKGSHCDLGMAIALGKAIEIKHEFVPDGKEKSYIKVIKEINKRR